MISNLSGKGVDIVFCAGNCSRAVLTDVAGPREGGSGNSILSTSSYPEVLTVGAVRVDGIPLGYSSQGQAKRSSRAKKPDLVAPSNFSEPSNAPAKNPGTSAACAVAAGVVAALREK